MDDQQIIMLGKQIRLDLLKLWPVNHAPLSGALSIVDVYIILFLRVLDLDAWASDPVKRTRVIPKTTSANALYYVLNYAGLLQVEDDEGKLIFYPPVVHKDKWAGDLDGTLTRNLGQGIGLAFHAKFNGHNNDVIAFISEGDLQAGVDHAAKLAASWQLNNLTVVLDCNKMQSSRSVIGVDPSLSQDDDGSLPELRRIWESYGWEYLEMDGHDYSNIEQTLRRIGANKRPLIIVAKTTKGKGVPLIESDPVHYSHRLTEDELASSIAGLELELQQLSEKVKLPRIMPQDLKIVEKLSSRPLQIPRIEYDVNALPFDILRDWLTKFRDDNPEDVFILNTDNALPFDPDVQIYSPERKSQHLQIGVNEKLALNVARGIANAGAFPIYTTPATHMQVVAEDLQHCALAKDPVLLIGTFPGVDLCHWGPSHSSYRDISMLSFVGVGVFQPATADDMYVILDGIYQHPEIYLPSYVRVPSREFMKNSDIRLKRVDFNDAFANGCYWFHDDLPGRSEILFAASGISLKECLSAAAELRQQGVKCNVINILNLQQINGELLNALAENPKYIISAIDADPSVLTNLIWKYLKPDLRPKLVSLGVTDFSESCYSREQTLSQHRIDAASLINHALELLELSRGTRRKERTRHGDSDKVSRTRI